MHMNARVDGDDVILTISRDQLALLANCMNEAMEAVEDWEFSTRLGVDKSVARALARDLGEALHRSGDH